MSIPWATIENAIQAFVAAATSLPGTSVIWAAQTAPRPARPYLVLNVLNLRGFGVQDEQRVSSPNAGAAWAANTLYLPNTQITVGGNTWWTQDGGTTTNGAQPAGLSANSPPSGTTVTDGTISWLIILPGQEVTISTYGVRELTVSCQAYSANMTGAGTARDYLSQVLDSASRQTLLDTLRASRIVLVSAGQPRDLTALVETAFESRAAAELVFRLADSLVDHTGYIASVALTPSVTT